MDKNSKIYTLNGSKIIDFTKKEEHVSEPADSSSYTEELLSSPVQISTPLIDLSDTVLNNEFVISYDSADSTALYDQIEKINTKNRNTCPLEEQVLIVDFEKDFWDITFFETLADIHRLNKSKRELKESDTEPRESDTELRESDTELRESDTELRESDTELRESDTELRESDTELKESDTELKESDNPAQELEENYPDDSDPYPNYVEGSLPAALFGEEKPDLTISKAEKARLSIVMPLKVKFKKDDEAKSFVAFIKSQSMARHSKILYIDINLQEELVKRLNLDIDFSIIENLQLSKLYAYQGLYLSTARRINTMFLPKTKSHTDITKGLSDSAEDLTGSTESSIDSANNIWQLNEETVIVLPDNPSAFLEDFKKNLNEDTFGSIKRDYLYSENVYYITNNPSPAKPGKIEILEYNKPNSNTGSKEELKNDTMFDGEGIISESYSKYINEYLGIKNATSFQIRMPFVKGMLHEVRFKEFLKEVCETESVPTNDGLYIIDVFGKKRDLLKAEIILTESMFKATKWIKKVFEQTNRRDEDPIKYYFEKFKEYEHSLYISGTSEPYTGRTTVKLNYQLLSTLDLSNEDFLKLLEEHNKFIENPIALFSSEPVCEGSNEEAENPDEYYTEESMPSDSSDTESEEDKAENDSESENNIYNGSDDTFSSETDVNEEDDLNLYKDENEAFNLINWMRAAAQSNKIKNHDFISSKLTALKKSLIKDIAYGKIIVSGEIRYLSRDLLLFLKYLLELHYEYHVQNNFYESKDELERLIYNPESIINSELLDQDYFFMPTINNQENIYQDEEYYPIFRNPHLSREEQCALKGLSVHKGSLRDRYLSHLKSVLMVSGKSFSPMILGGADFDGDIVKVLNNPTIRDSVLQSVYEKCSSNSNIECYRRKLPIVKISAFNPVTNGKTYSHWIINYYTIYHTFSNHVGMISNRSVALSEKEYIFGHYEPKDYQNTLTNAWFTIATGLEIDACKSGIHPILDRIENYIEFKKEFFEDIYNKDLFSYKNKDDDIKLFAYDKNTKKSAISEKENKALDIFFSAVGTYLLHPDKKDIFFKSCEDYCYYYRKTLSDEWKEAGSNLSNLINKYGFKLTLSNDTDKEDHYVSVINDKYWEIIQDKQYNQNDNYFNFKKKIAKTFNELVIHPKDIYNQKKFTKIAGRLTRFNKISNKQCNTLDHIPSIFMKYFKEYPSKEKVKQINFTFSDYKTENNKENKKVIAEIKKVIKAYNDIIELSKKINKKKNILESFKRSNEQSIYSIIRKNISNGSISDITKSMNIIIKISHNDYVNSIDKYLDIWPYTDKENREEILKSVFNSHDNNIDSNDFNDFISNLSDFRNRGYFLLYFFQQLSKIENVLKKSATNPINLFEEERFIISNAEYKAQINCIYKKMFDKYREEYQKKTAIGRIHQIIFRIAKDEINNIASPLIKENELFVIIYNNSKKSSDFFWRFYSSKSPNEILKLFGEH